MLPSRRKWLKRFAIYFALAATLWLLASYAGVYWLTRRPHAVFAEPLPELSWGKAQSFRIATADGEELGAWFIDGRADQPLVLLLHGYRGCRRNCLPQAKIAADAGCPVLLISCRAHGDSTGDKCDVGYTSRKDVVAAVEWLRQRHPGRPVIVWGQSQGAAAAIFAASELNDQVAGYILECPYRDLRAAVWHRMEFYLPPIVRNVAYAGATFVAPLILPEVDDISPVKEASSIPKSARVLILAGEKDWRAPPDEARAIHARVQAPSRLLIVPGADHVRFAKANSQLYQEAVLQLIGECGHDFITKTRKNEITK